MCENHSVWQRYSLKSRFPCIYEPRKLSSTHHWHGFSMQFYCQIHQTSQAQRSWIGSYGNGVASPPCATGPRYYLNKCSYQETATCHDKTCLKVSSHNTAIAGFSIKKIGLDDFSIFNTDWQHKCKVPWSTELTITQKIAQSMYKLLDKQGRGKSSRVKKILKASAAHLEQILIFTTD